jgi:hypothetical protein
MDKKHLTIIVAIATLSTVALVASAIRSGSSSAPAQSVSVNMSSYWVPFSAQIVDRAAGKVVRTGQFHRNSAGSNTTILQSSDGPVITIHDFPNRQTFAKLGTKDWFVYPFSEDMKTVPKPSLSFSSRVRELAKPVVAGMPVFEMNRPDGAAVRLAPGLNGFPIYTRRADGSTKEFVDIVLAEPPAELFAPPTGAVVIQRKREEVIKP